MSANRTTNEMVAIALRDYLQWVSLGANPNDKVFRRYHALCANVARHMKMVQEIPASTGETLDTMEVLFRQYGMHPVYPFGGVNLYEHEGDIEAYHLNLDRLQWARDIVNRYG